jgi:hypothetical protein
MRNKISSYTPVRAQSSLDYGSLMRKVTGIPQNIATPLNLGGHRKLHTSLEIHKSIPVNDNPKFYPKPNHAESRTKNFTPSVMCHGLLNDISKKESILSQTKQTNKVKKANHSDQNPICKPASLVKRRRKLLSNP